MSEIASSPSAQASSTQKTLSALLSSTQAISLPSIEANLSPSSRKSVSDTIGAFAKTAASQDSSTFTSPASSSSSSSFFASPSPPFSPAANFSDKSGLIVGGVIGGVAVLALISGIFVWNRQHHDRRKLRGDGIRQAAGTDQIDSEEHVVANDNEIHEVDAPRPIRELDSRSIAELEPWSFAR